MFPLLYEGEVFKESYWFILLVEDRILEKFGEVKEEARIFFLFSMKKQIIVVLACPKFISHLCLARNLSR